MTIGDTITPNNKPIFVHMKLELIKFLNKKPIKEN